MYSGNSASLQTPPISGEPIITVSFCGDDDHVVITIGGTQDGRSLDALGGLIATLKPWVKLEECSRVLSDPDQHNAYRHEVFHVENIGPYGADLCHLLRTDHGFRSSMMTRIATQLREFLAIPKVQRLLDAYYDERI